ncbi:MAG: Na+/H+ antiporter NhaA [Bdellovibrionota bacterium]
MFKFVQRFMQRESASGIVLGLAAVLAMVVANSAASAWYFEVFSTRLGPWTLTTWINDVLMAIFFFVVGMEIKYELVDGALASRERATLPIVAALGGMIAPALIYTAFNHGSEFESGWGVPMATDIAFAVGALTMLGKRVSTALKVFLLALAIADDLGAVLVIAIFYSSGVKLVSLGLAVGIAGLIWWLAKKSVRYVPLHIALGASLWFLVHESGIHATVAGCVLGFLMPHADSTPDDPTPLERWVERLHPFVGFAIMPIFAFANAGLVFKDFALDEAIRNHVVLGVGLGLVVGKAFGIYGACWLAESFGIARRSDGITRAQLFGAACLGGIGFTMALFVSQLAFSDRGAIEFAKIGIVFGSLASASIGTAVLASTSRAR